MRLFYEISSSIMSVLPYDSFEEALNIASCDLTLIGKGHSSAIYNKDEAKYKSSL